MSSLRLLAALPTLALMGGCWLFQSETAYRHVTEPGYEAPPTTPSMTVLSGIVLNGEDGIALYMGEESSVRLFGNQLNMLANVVGTEVRVRGNWTATGLNVNDFLVLSVDGQAAMDGVLEATEEGYRLHLTDSGGYQDLQDIPDGLRDCVGLRVWIAPADGAEAAFGIISEIF